MCSATTHWSNCSSVRRPSERADSFRESPGVSGGRETFRMGVLGDLSSIVIADVTIESSDKHKGLGKKGRDAVFVGDNAGDAMNGEGAGR